MKNNRQNNSNFRMMALAYCLGTFNDNLFKQAALLLMVAAGLHAMQGTATLLFALPFALFASYGGYLADKYPKQKVVLLSKWLELIGTLLGSVGIIFGYWYLILAMIVVMSTQSVIFSPALNGAIPENFEPEFVPKANGIIKLTTTCSILLGMGLAGFMLDLFPTVQVGNVAVSRILVGATCVLISVIGIISAMRIRNLHYTKSDIPFPWLGPLNSVFICVRLLRDKHLLLAFACDAFFYGVSTNLIIVINVLTIRELGGSQTEASMVIFAMMMGVASGAFLMSRHIHTTRWARSLAPSLLGMAISFCAVYGVNYFPGDSAWRLYYCVLMFALAGFCGGLFLLPFTNFIQIRPVTSEKGRIIGTTYFTAFGAVGLLGLAYSKYFAIAFSSVQLILFLGIATLFLSALVWLIVRYLDRAPLAPAKEILS